MSVSLKEKEELIKELYNITSETKQKLDDVLSKMLKKINSFLSVIEERQFRENVEKGNNSYNNYQECDWVCDCDEDCDFDCDCKNENCDCNINLEKIDKKQVELDKKIDELVEEDFQLSKQRDELKKIVDVFQKVEDAREEKKQTKEELKKIKKKEAKDRAKELLMCDTCDLQVRRDCFARHLKSKAHIKKYIT